MFTGLIEEIGVLTSVVPSGSGFDISVGCVKVLDQIALGDSIAIDGVCQTVTAFTKTDFTVFTSRITRDVTTLAQKKHGDKVNLERAMRVGDRFGGHFVQGHVDDTGKVISLRRDESGLTIVICAEKNVMRQIAAKGSISVDGVSLTVTEKGNNSFSLYCIPETISRTTLPLLREGSTVNIETDVLGKYVEALVCGSKDDEHLLKALRENGFM